MWATRLQYGQVLRNRWIPAISTNLYTEFDYWKKENLCLWSKSRVFFFFFFSIYVPETLLFKYENFSRTLICKPYLISDKIQLLRHYYKCTCLSILIFIVSQWKGCCTSKSPKFAADQRQQDRAPTSGRLGVSGSAQLTKMRYFYFVNLELLTISA